jgi:tetratricopeptide (TPR) repeat protein
MAFNKTKALESALKFLNQGKVAQAIGEYQQILRHDPKDQATLMTVGDLYARQGDMSHAVEYFERLAQVYLSDGFNSKAIAIYKKIAKLAPSELAPLERLADLYIQQGVLSEARPLFLQIAEAHLKANRAPKAVEVLQRLLDVEPDNPRVQMRLAELYNVMGQKKEAAQVYYNYALRLHEHGDDEESQKLIERAVSVDPGNAAAALLKAKIFAAANKNSQAIALLESHPEADTGGEVTALLIDLQLKAGELQKATERGRKQLLRGSGEAAVMMKVAEAALETGRAKEALSLVRDLREPLVQAGEHDKFVALLSTVSEKLPGDPEPLEMLADFARHSSDPFQLKTALTKLVDVYADTGNFSRSEELLRELIDKNKDDERLATKLDELRARSAGTPIVQAQPEPQPEPTMAALFPREEPRAHEPKPETEPAPPVAAADEPLDEETQRYIAQALTDVDLFSSYGLTNKAVQLLEAVLQRAPRHTSTLERLLDMSLGAGNDRRTAELASQLEQIYLKREDTTNAERFTELRQRFQKAAGVTEEELISASVPREQASISAAPPIATDAASVSPVVEAATTASERATTAVPVEFEIPIAPVEPEPARQVDVSPPIPAQPPAQPPIPRPAATTEVDLSDEWEAMVQEVAEPPALAAPQEVSPAPVEAQQSQPAAPEQVAQPSAEPTFEFDEAPRAESAQNAEFELELASGLAAAQDHKGPATTEDFLSELAAEVEGMESPVKQDKKPTPPVHAAALETAPEPKNGPAPAEAVPEMTVENLNELAEVFQEFRNELGEMEEGEDEDLETHYNLGIAYREMGLLDEAIGEFQKVAKAVQKGRPFAYAMNCATLLALSFMDKNEPKIAAVWYKRALETPRLDQESVLALRYDLGVALDMAGESGAALDSFRQVYAMNIDYRDVADRIAMLQKH